MNDVTNIYSDVTNDTNSYFDWLALVDAVSTLTRDRWDDVFKKNIYEFFTCLAYLKTKNEKEKQMIEKWRRSH